MKTQERVSCTVKPEFFTSRDPEFVEEYKINTDHNLLFEINMKELVRVDDLYKDGTTFYKTLKKGNGSASPYMDCLVACKN